MSTKQPQYIIAIGASAGGLEEINSFFDHTPCDGVSYVIVQHLSSDFKSRMAELLARHSKLVIRQAEDAMTVYANQVYLIPNDKFMTIDKGKLYLSQKGKMNGPNLTINRFFNSLADYSGKKAIGVILSGLGSDGTEGIKSIKHAGGMVIARTPETTEFNSMPSNAIATGLVDFVVEPAAMPDIIENYVKHSGNIPRGDRNEEQNIKSIIDLIKDQLPLDFSDYKPTTILRRIKRRATDNNFVLLENYFDYLKETPAELEALAKDFLISVTSFFRDKEAFEFIEKKVIPDILENLAPNEELKMWVAGCATGEEAYSLAILIKEQLTGKFKDTVAKIFATDIDTVALIHARNGIFKTDISKQVSGERLENFFTKENKNYRVNPEIRSMVIFAQHDLVKNPPYCNMHFISCRNLLIYMMPALQKKIYFMLLFGLKKNGYLFLGASENPMPIVQNLEITDKKWKIYKNLEAKRAISFDTFSLPQMVHVNGKRSFDKPKNSLQNTKDSLAEAVNLNLIEELDSLAICIDENNQVVRTYGDTTKYLLQKNFNLNLSELLPDNLALAFNAMKTEVLKTDKKSSVSGINMKRGTEVISINITVTPLHIKDVGQGLLMVSIREDKEGGIEMKDAKIFDEKVFLDKYTLDIQNEVKELKAKLHSTYEQLDRSNDNMQSFNEELLSANEEMQSTNEEMQSVNEELHTVNTDYQLKNRELQEINDDLNNYFRSNINGQLFVDNDMKLVKFSPGAVTQINLVESDVGRAISHISTNIKLDTITEDIQKVIVEGSIITKEIETNSGQWYQVMTMPYIRQSNNTQSGAIITFNDITKLKKTQYELDKKNITLQRINDDLDNFVYVASHDLLSPLANIEQSIEVMNEIKVSGESLNKILNIINSSIKKFRSLVTDMATIGKIENEKMEMVDVNQIIDNIEWSLDDKIKQSGAVINRELEINQILFSKNNLRSILYNLISNAIKFKGDSPPLINIHSKKEEENVVLSVQDNGIGLSKTDLEKVFDLYGRIHHDIEGQGIGLYLAKKIVDASGGNITVESKDGQGSKFNIFFKTEPEASGRKRSV
ncbi:MAG: chemotaxis protein CheB [Ginsengibacter sp.]